MKRNLAKKFIFTTRELIEIQSLFYYQNNHDLGFTSLANTLTEYPETVFTFIDRVLSICKLKKVDIIELGPGTLFFTKQLLSLLRSNNYKVNYSVVDVNKAIKPICKDLQVQFINQTFEYFGRTNKTRFDFIIMNQSLDMWAGSNFIIHKNSKYSIVWKVFDDEKRIYLSQKELEKLSELPIYEHLFWIKYYKSPKKLISSLKYFPLEDEHTYLPYSLFYLIQKIRFGGFIQDYWNFDKSVSLRAGLTSNDCSRILKIFPFNKQDSIIQNNLIAITNNSNFVSIVTSHKINLINWFQSNIIPFGIRDVTYSPQIFRIVTLLEKSGFNTEILTIKNLVNKLLANIENKIEENEFGSEKNIILFEKKTLIGLKVERQTKSNFTNILQLESL